MQDKLEKQRTSLLALGLKNHDSIRSDVYSLNSDDLSRNLVSNDEDTLNKPAREAGLTLQRSSEFSTKLDVNEHLYNEANYRTESQMSKDLVKEY